MLFSNKKNRIWKKGIRLTPLKYNTVLSICRELSASGITLEKMDSEDDNILSFVSEYNSTILNILALASINKRIFFCQNRIMNNQVKLFKETLTDKQIYELFVYIIDLSGIKSFTYTLKTAFTTKKEDQNPKENFDT
jgi:hypothetical protein